MIVSASIFFLKKKKKKKKKRGGGGVDLNHGRRTCVSCAFDLGFMRRRKARQMSSFSVFQETIRTRERGARAHSSSLEGPCEETVSPAATVTRAQERVTPKRARILSIASELPPGVRTSSDVEALVAERSPGLRFRRGVIESMTGIRTRRVAEGHVQCSDLAAGAAKRALAEAGLAPQDVGVLIFASAGQDSIEPATAHIVQDKLGTRCPVFDVKNACNSFLNGVQLAESLVLSGRAQTTRCSWRQVKAARGRSSGACRMLRSSGSAFFPPTPWATAARRVSWLGRTTSAASSFVPLRRAASTGSWPPFPRAGRCTRGARSSPTCRVTDHDYGGPSRTSVPASFGRCSPMPAWSFRASPASSFTR